MGRSQKPTRFRSRRSRPPLLALRSAVYTFSSKHLWPIHATTLSPLSIPSSPSLIPVLQRRATIDEILRRVIETEPRQEIILVDDCSTDGTRQILEKMLQLQNAGESCAPAMDGADSIALRDPPHFLSDS